MKQKPLASDKKLEKISQSSPNQFRVRDGQEDNSILFNPPAEKDQQPLHIHDASPPDKGQTAFIDRQCNSKEEG